MVASTFQFFLFSPTVGTFIFISLVVGFFFFTGLAPIQASFLFCYAFGSYLPYVSAGSSWLKD